jgi:NAD(P)-dependent dehydrogenase (short-subunit alcohol dehydrogenase family)
MNFSSEIEGKKVVIIGGTAGMGLAIAKMAKQNKANVTIASRTIEKVNKVKNELNVNGIAIDLMNEESIISFFKEIGTIDYLIIPGSQVKIESLEDTSKDDLEFSIRSKLIGPALCCKYARFNPGGSVTLFSGALSRRPVKGVALLGAVNGGVESLVKGLALELSPIRINCISPGLVRDTDAYLDMPEAAREGMFKGFAESVPAKKVGTGNDIAMATLSIMTNTFITGSIIDVDGGAIIR